MSLDSYHVGDRVEVLVSGTWSPGTVAVAQGPFFPLIVALDSGVNWPVTSDSDIRHAGSAASGASFAVGDRIDVRSGANRWAGSVAGIRDDGCLAIDLQGLDGRVTVSKEMLLKA